MDYGSLSGRVKGTLIPPCSKSYAQRALASALLAEGVTTLRNLDYCQDTRSALGCIRTLGARVTEVDATTLRIEGGLRPLDVRLQVCILRHLLQYGNAASGRLGNHPYLLGRTDPVLR
ncbi:MAG: hypothetical protein IJ990_06235 [Alistipes sp.]|nr:hypothetical protein [Alistipes sp.]